MPDSVVSVVLDDTSNEFMNEGRLDSSSPIRHIEPEIGQNLPR